MDLSLLSVFASAVTDLTPGYMTEETLTTGVMTTIIGMGVVFSVLVILFFCIKAMAAAIERSTKAKAAEAPVKAPVKAPVAAPVAAPAPASPAAVPAVKKTVTVKGPASAPAAKVAVALAAVAAMQDGAIDRKTVAAITAAVSAVMGRPAAQLRFRAVRRGGVNSVWSSDGTTEIIHTRQQYL